MSKSLYAQEEIKNREMLLPESVMWLLKIITPPLWIWMWIQNLDNIKSTIIFIVTLGMGLILFYFRIARIRRNNRKIDLENQRIEGELLDQMLVRKEKEVELFERELRARITGIPKDKK